MLPDRCFHERRQLASFVVQDSPHDAAALAELGMARASAAQMRTQVQADAA
ncbi:hypothetical protein AZ54_11895 [Xanthomonas oryzae pv. oryzae PXO86]|uniref:Uncharacterized protein n=1 Tax=Xanthomonas oryzae pv. oryzae (strain PXO99A) TaxID=360094 RepID=A0A0K0GL23_XANOP|nr:hypothetical protein PXO_00898 [Xanthomonas oryzae pv. oryzae PXO99A]AJQ83225.1 hypothetical protein AZ54_11895 [Xanthomonas oryzae pv. oryzae PXO86]